MRDYMIGSNPNVFSMLGEDFHPDLLALIVKELLRLIGREFSKRRFLKLNKKIPGVKRALELPASVMADRLFEDVDKLRDFFEQLRGKIGPRGLRRHPVDLDTEFGVDKTFGTSTGRVTLLADLLEIEQLIEVSGAGGDSIRGGVRRGNVDRGLTEVDSEMDGQDQWQSLFRRMRAAAQKCHAVVATAAPGGIHAGSSMFAMDPEALLLKAVELRSAKIPRRLQAMFESAVRAFDWNGDSGSDLE